LRAALERSSDRLQEAAHEVEEAGKAAAITILDHPMRKIEDYERRAQAGKRAALAAMYGAIDLAFTAGRMVAAVEPLRDVEIWLGKKDGEA
jgi:hypothetical protein